MDSQKIQAKNSIFEKDGQSVFLDKIEPSIYAFAVPAVNEIANSLSLKVGDTSRYVHQRLDEWRKIYPDLVKVLDTPAFFMNSDNVKVYFRDYSVHRFLLDNGYVNLPSDVIHSAGFKHASREFYSSTSSSGDLTGKTILDAVEEIKNSYGNPGARFTYYTSLKGGPRLAVAHYNPTLCFEMREFQRDIVQSASGYFMKENFGNPFNQYLLVAPTRSGKSHMAMRIAKEVADQSSRQHNVVLVVSAYAEVMEEWKQTVEAHSAFNQRCYVDGEGYVGDTDFAFFNVLDFKNDSEVLDKAFKSGVKNAVVFMTLQDLSGSTSGDGVKNVHKWLQEEDAVQFIIADEAHFAVFTEGGRYQEALGSFSGVDSATEERVVYSKLNKNGNAVEWVPTEDEEIESSSRLKAIVPTFGTLFITATPFNILSSGFNFTNGVNASIVTTGDILKERDEWDAHNNSLPEDEVRPDWENPCYGLPERHTFAVNLGVENLNDFFGAKRGKFLREDAVRNVIRSLFGMEGSVRVPNILQDTNFQNAGLGNHVYMTLPSRESVGAMKNVLNEVLEESGLADEYLVLDISSGGSRGAKSKYSEMSSSSINAVIDETDKKTITISCERMGTGVTQKKWDTVMIMRTMNSAQKFVQVSGRAGTPWVETHNAVQSDGSHSTEDAREIFKTIEKPNCAVIGFDPFQTLAINYVVAKSEVENQSGAKVNGIDGRELDKSLAERLGSSPLYVIDLDPEKGRGLIEMRGSDILSAVLRYSDGKGVRELADPLALNEQLITDQGFLRGLEKFVPEPYESRKAGVVSAYGDTENFVNSPECFTKDCSNLKVDSKNFCKDCLEAQEKEAERLKAIRAKMRTAKNNKGAPQLTAEEKADLRAEAQSKKDAENRYKTAVASILLLVALSPERERSLSEILELLEDSKKVNGSYYRRAKNLNVHEGLIRFLIGSGAADLQLDDLIFVLQSSMEKTEEPMERMKIAINSFGRFSPNEIPTPQKVADLLNDKIEWSSKAIETFRKSKGVIDPGCKSGIILHEFYRRGREAGLTHEEMREKIYAIPTSPQTYELLSTIYREMDWDPACILWSDNHACLTVGRALAGKISGNLDIILDEVDGLEVLLSEFKQGEKFGFVVSNPPYQIETGNGTVKDIFHLFQLASMEIAVSTVMIYPARRWLQESGKGSSDFGKRLIRDKRLKSVDIYNADEVFEKIGVQDGVSITCWDSSSVNKKVLIDGVEISRPNEGEIIVLDVKFESIVSKVLKIKNLNKNTSYSKQKLFGIESNHYHTRPETMSNLSSEGLNDPVKIFTIFSKGSSPMWGWIERSELKSQDFIDKFKVIISSSHPIRDFDLTLKLINPNEVHGRSRASIRMFESYSEAKNFIDFMKTKLTRKLFSLSPDGLTRMGAFVPDLEDYTDDNPIFMKDSDLPTDHEYYGLDLDHRLYKLFKLSEEEIAVIEGE